MEYFLELASKTAWEQVDEFAWKHWKDAVAASGEQRYSGNKVCRNGTGITIDAQDLSARDAAIVMRFLGVKDTAAPGSVNGGFVIEPEFVKFKRSGGVVLHEINGESWKKAG